MGCDDGVGQEDDDEWVSGHAVDAGAAPLNVDGEMLGETGSRRWAVEPGGWSVVVPGDR